MRDYSEVYRTFRYKKAALRGAVSCCNRRTVCGDNLQVTLYCSSLTLFCDGANNTLHRYTDLLVEDKEQ
jgi:hypothetical protein